MPREKMNPAQRRYLWRFLPAMAAYVVVLLPVVWLFNNDPPPAGFATYALAALPALPIVAIIVVVALYLVEEKDEFLRMRQAMAMLIGLGLTLTATSVWGFFEYFAHAPHLDIFLVFPGFCAAWGFASGVLAWVYR